MLDVRLVIASIAVSISLMSVAFAEPTKDQAPPVARSSAEDRPIRVILPAPWEASTRQAETQPAR